MKPLDQVMVEVTEANFDVEVIERSQEVPVLVDFWAPWCGPCRTLGPVLEELATKWDGGFILAKANTEDHPALGSRYSIRSIPAAKLFHRGKVIGGFVGALPASQVERFLTTYIPSEADDLVSAAALLLGNGDSAGAREKLREALEVDDAHAAANLGLAKIALSEGEVDLVNHHVDAINPLANEYEEAQHVLEATAFVTECEAVGGEDKARERVTADEVDLDARYGLGCCLARQQRWADALEELLEAVKRNNKHRDGAARKAMVTIFGIIGHDSDLADQYVRQLQIYT